MKLVLDTNRYTDLCKGIASVVETVEVADEVLLAFIVLGVLRAGFADEQTRHHYAAVYRQLRKQGTPILTNDMDRSPRSRTLACPFCP